MVTMSQAKVVAAIVAYRPDEPLLRRVVDATAQMVSEVIVVKNDCDAWANDLKGLITLYEPGDNIGLAAAYNLAAEHARREGATHLLLLDQDSVPAPGMVERLLREYGRPEKIAAVGPVWRDPRTGKLGSLTVRFGSRHVPQPGEVVEVSFLISSGSLISLSAFSDIGPFDDNLFIEHVDTDWSLRARAKGYRLYGVADAILEHTIGEGVIAASGTGRTAYRYPPERTYYLTRNSIRLWRRPYATWRWRLFDAWRLLRLLTLYLTFASQRRERLLSVVHGVRDAFRSEIGKRPTPAAGRKQDYGR